MPLNILTTLPSGKKWISRCNVGLHARDQVPKKHLAQSGRSTWSAVDIFNTLYVFTKEPIRG